MGSAAEAAVGAAALAAAAAQDHPNEAAAVAGVVGLPVLVALLRGPQYDGYAGELEPSNVRMLLQDDQLNLLSDEEAEQRQSLQQVRYDASVARRGKESNWRADAVESSVIEHAASHSSLHHPPHPSPSAPCRTTMSSLTSGRPPRGRTAAGPSSSSAPGTRWRRCRCPRPMG